MSIKFEPSKLIKKFAPARKIKKLVSSRATLKKSALSFVNDIDFISKKSIARVALKTINGYKKRIKADPDIEKELLKDAAQLVQRVQNEVIFQIGNELKDRYHGESYTWLPSDAEEPRPEHQLNYGKVFQIGEGEMPGDAFGCRCGMEIHTADSTLAI